MENEYVSEDREPALPNKARPSSLSRFVTWCWGGATLSAADLAWRRLDERATVLVERARTSIELAEIALRPQQPFVADAAPIASELYRQAVYWLLSALARVSGRELNDDSTAIWDSLSPTLLSRVATHEELAFTQTALRAGSFVYFAELDERERARVSRCLTQLAEALLRELGDRSSALKALLFRRSLAVASLLALVAGCLWLPYSFWKRQRMVTDLSTASTWRTSSDFGFVGCQSPKQDCLEYDGYFFHTQIEDRNPWIEFDLGSHKQVSRLLIDNRRDCCIDRSVPLVIELSNDRKHYRVVAKNSEEFWTWRAEFPTQTARWVRVRIPHRGTLHLGRVRIER
jgi:hypothetical protein